MVQVRTGGRGRVNIAGLVCYWPGHIDGCLTRTGLTLEPPVTHRHKTALEHVIAATAVNLIRLEAYWTGRPLGRTRSSQHARLDFTQVV